MLYGLAAYLMWGLFPAFFPLLTPAAPVEILAHRVCWTAVLMIGVLSFTKGWAELRQAGRAQWVRMAVCGVLVTGNWGIYVAAVNSGHVADAALGYFINPLVSVALGMIFLGEKLPRTQVIAVLIAVAGVVYLTVLAGAPPLIGIGLAGTFGFYGLIKKGVHVSAVGSLAAETLVITPIALGYLVYLELTGAGTFVHLGTSHSLLLVSSGIVTALPLLAFGQATKLVPLTTIGMLQFITPTLAMLWALFVVDEQLSASEWWGYGIIWCSVGLFLASIVVSMRTLRRKVVEEPHTWQRPAPSD